jgi:hypothetical protein
VRPADAIGGGGADGTPLAAAVPGSLLGPAGGGEAAVRAGQCLRGRGEQRRPGAGSVPVVRSGKSLLRKRGDLAAAGLTEAQWQAQWQAARCS